MEKILHIILAFYMPMDASFKNIDISFRDSGSLPRVTSSRFKVPVIGSHRKKTSHWVRRSFETFNVSFILDGGGAFRVGDTTLSVMAPCILIQRPGIYLEYGPTSPPGFWHEVYFIYPPDTMDLFHRLGFLSPDQWIITDIHRETAVSRITEIASLASSPASPGVADRLDATCEILLMEHFVPVSSSQRTEAQESLADLRSEIFRSPEALWDIGSEARKRGMSESTFRRVWSEIESLPPARFIYECRMNHASRELVHTADSIGMVARRCGFPDALHFSRRFKQYFGLSPRKYRIRYRTFD